MSPFALRLLWGLIAVGLAGRLAIAFATFGLTYDVESAATVGAELSGPHPLQVYDAVNRESSGIEGEVLFRWPYPSGFFPWIGLGTAIDHRSPLPFHGLVQLPAIV